MVNAKTWNPAEIDQAIHRLEGIIRSGSYNPAELNQLLNQLGEPGYINTWNPAELDQKLRTLLHDLLTWKTATGNPIQLRTNNGGLVQSCEVTFSPIQDLHGQSAPYPAGGGKNKYTSKYGGRTNNGITYSLSNGNIILNGKTTETSYYASSTTMQDLTNYVSLPAGTYTLNKTNLDYISFRLYNYNGFDVSLIGSSTKTEKLTFTLESDSSVSVNVKVDVHNETYTDKELFIQIESGSSETDYAPYSNICPISGRDSLHLYQDTEQTETPETTHTATFPDTVYGGKWLPQEGKAVITHAIVDLGSLTWSMTSTSGCFRTHGLDSLAEIGTTGQADAISTIYTNNPTARDVESMPDYSFCVGGSQFSYKLFIKDTRYTSASDFESAISGQKIYYKLSTPTEITLTSEEIELLSGANVLWTDGDSIEITYKKLLLPSDVESLSKSKKIEEKPKTKRSKKKKEE